jgi:diaminopimelate epimerase
VATRSELHLTKHHGAGNDFLVLLDLDDRRPVDAAEVRALCDRRRGVGADGVLRAVPPAAGARIGMELHNADGGRAEMSGNGIRCLVQAAVDAGVVAAGAVVVSTDAGNRTVDFHPGDAPGVASASVDMGPVELGEELADGELRRSEGGDGGGAGRWRPGDGAGTALPEVERGRLVNTGNPHLVLWGGPVAEATVAAVGGALEAASAEGLNVEFVWPGPARDEIRLRVWERGAGLTLACGTGSCAAAAAAQSWGAVGPRVAVHNPGGTLTVTLEAGRARLEGPTRRVAEVLVDEATLAGLVSTLAAGSPLEVDPVA